MKVTLINVTPFALETLIFTKSTRLRMTGVGLEEIKAWPEEKKMAELEYMLGTIQSSWEFVDYIFMIEGVTRAFTHQLVRHRVGTSFAQQAQRAVDMSDFDYLATGPLADEDSDAAFIYRTGMDDIKNTYAGLIEEGVPPQDARGILPTNILTNICFKANLRTLHDMGLKRLCVKAQGEFQDVFRAIRAEMIRVHPWTERMIRVQCATNGTCIFPSYPVEQCPVKPFVYNPQTGHAYGLDTPFAYPVNPLTPDEIQGIWETNRAEAQPGLPRETP